MLNRYIGIISISWLPIAGSANDYLTKTRQLAPEPKSPTITPAAKLNTQTTDVHVGETELIWKGVSSSFAFPFEEWSAPEDSEHSFFYGLSGNIAIGYPLLETPSANLPANATSGPTNTNITATLSLKYTILGNWFVSTTLYHYFDSQQQQPWNPDFTYVFGYSDWRPYTLSLIYSNYGGNRFHATKEQAITEFKQGTWSLGWKFPVTEPVIDWLSFTDEGAVGCQIDFNYTPEYFDMVSTSYRTSHKTLSLGCKYSIAGNWYVNSTIFYYFNSQQKQPWNPDYTYGFGYFDWRPGTFTLQYNNYSGNRWHPSERGDDTGRFKDGSITLSYSFSF